jgi:hypothetical protein
VLPESQAYWTAADEGRLLVKKCKACGEVHHYPRDVCPHCLSVDTDGCRPPAPAPSTPFSTMGKGEAAYTLAFVTLDEGVTLMTNLVDCDPATVSIGQPGAGGLQAQRRRSRRAHVHARLMEPRMSNPDCFSKPHALRKGPLSRFTILDATRVRAGPTAIRTFADLGARVIKLEIPPGAPGGDDMIGGRDHNRADYENLHRNKESLTLNMKEPEGLAILHALAKDARRVHRELPARRQVPAGHRPRPAARHQPEAGLRQHFGLRPGRALRQLARFRFHRPRAWAA